MTTRAKTAVFLVVLLGLSAFSCYLMWFFSKAAGYAFHDFLHGRPLPALTNWLVDYKLAILLMPMPWVVAAVHLVIRNDASPFPLIVFTSTLTLALITTAIVFFIAFTMPWVSRISTMHVE